MFNDLIKRDVIEKIGFIIVRIKEPHVYLETEFLGDTPDVFIRFHAVYITSARFMVAKCLAEATPYIQNANILWHPAIG